MANTKSKIGGRSLRRVRRLVRLLEIASDAQEALAVTYHGLGWRQAAFCAELDAESLRQKAKKYAKEAA